MLARGIGLLKRGICAQVDVILQARGQIPLAHNHRAVFGKIGRGGICDSVGELVIGIAPLGAGIAHGSVDHRFSKLNGRLLLHIGNLLKIPALLLVSAGLEHTRKSRSSGGSGGS